MIDPVPIPDAVRAKRDRLARAGTQVRWCDDVRLRDEHVAGAGPGGWLARFGWYVVGTTIGGNAIVVGEDDPGVYFADHTWYSDEGIDYQPEPKSTRWVSLPLTPEHVRTSLWRVADSIEDFVARREELDATIDRLD